MTTAQHTAPAGQTIDQNDGERHMYRSTGDYFTADQAWLYISILTVGYLISRGLAKSGSRTNTDA